MQHNHNDGSYYGHYDYGSHGNQSHSSTHGGFGNNRHDHADDISVEWGAFFEAGMATPGPREINGDWNSVTGSGRGTSNVGSSLDLNDQKKKVSDAITYGPRFCVLYDTYCKKFGFQVDLKRHLMSLCTEHLIAFTKWARDSDEQVKWISASLFENDYLRPEVRNGVVIVLIYTFAAMKATIEDNSDMFITLQDHEQGLGIANKFSLKIYNDPYNYLSFLKTSISALIDAGAIPDNERQNQPKRNKVQFHNREEIQSFQHIQTQLVDHLDAGRKNEARNLVLHITNFWQQRGKFVRNRRFASALQALSQPQLYLPREDDLQSAGSGSGSGKSAGGQQPPPPPPSSNGSQSNIEGVVSHGGAQTADNISASAVRLDMSVGSNRSREDDAESDVSMTPSSSSGIVGSSGRTQLPMASSQQLLHSQLLQQPQQQQQQPQHLHPLKRSLDTSLNNSGGPIGPSQYMPPPPKRAHVLPADDTTGSLPGSSTGPPSYTLHGPLLQPLAAMRSTSTNSISGSNGNGVNAVGVEGDGEVRQGDVRHGERVIVPVSSSSQHGQSSTVPSLFPLPTTTHTALAMAKSPQYLVPTTTQAATAGGADKLTSPTRHQDLSSSQPFQSTTPLAPAIATPFQLSLPAIRCLRTDQQEWELQETHIFDVPAFLNSLSPSTSSASSSLSTDRTAYQMVSATMCGTILLVDEVALAEELRQQRLHRQERGPGGALAKELALRQALITSWPPSERLQLQAFLTAYRDHCQVLYTRHSHMVNISRSGAGREVDRPELKRVTTNGSSADVLMDDDDDDDDEDSDDNLDSGKEAYRSPPRPVYPSLCDFWREHLQLGRGNMSGPSSRMYSDATEANGVEFKVPMTAAVSSTGSDNLVGERRIRSGNSGPSQPYLNPLLRPDTLKIHRSGYLAYELPALVTIVLRSCAALNIAEDLWCTLYPSELQVADTTQSFGDYLTEHFPQLLSLSRKIRAASVALANQQTPQLDSSSHVLTAREITVKYFGHHHMSLIYQPETSVNANQHNHPRHVQDVATTMSGVPHLPSAGCFQTIGTFASPAHRVIAKLSVGPFVHDFVIEYNSPL